MISDLETLISLNQEFATSTSDLNISHFDRQQSVERSGDVRALKEQIEVMKVEAAGKDRQIA